MSDESANAARVIEAEIFTPDREVKMLKEVINTFTSQMQNWGFSFPGGLPPPAQIAEPGTIFHNLRWWLISNLRQGLSQAYAEIGLVRNIVQVPVDDALRGGLIITTSQLDEKQISFLTTYMDEKDDLEHLKKAGYWNRLYGGSANIIFTDQDPMTPLRMQKIYNGEDIEFRAVDMWELFYSLLNVGDGDFDESVHLSNYEYFDYYGEKIHRSRLLLQKGVEAPSFIRPKLRGWGMSVVENLVSSINQYLKAAGLTYEVLDEFKLDIYKINNFAAASMALGGLENVKKSVDFANWQKNFQNALVMDKDDEYESKQLTFAGLAEAQAGIRMQVASDMRMPMTKLFGMSAQGFNSGEDDIEVYNAMIEGTVRSQIKRPALVMVQIRCQELFGFIPDDLKIAFQPLKVLSSVQTEEVKNHQFQRILQATQANLMSPKEFADAANKNELLVVKIEEPSMSVGIASGIDDVMGGDADIEDQYRGDIEHFDPALDQTEYDEGDEGPMEKSKIKDTNDKKGTAKLSLVANSKIPGLVVLPKPYNAWERTKRAVTNSVRFDLEEYKSIGGDSWIDPRRKPFFEDPIGVDEGIWSRAEEESRKAFKRVKWQYVAFMYKKLGGKFSSVTP